MTLTIRNVKKSYGKKLALADLNLTIPPGIFGLIGPNGAGKTTLMEILATILRPDSGNIHFHTTNLLQHPDEIRQQLGYLPQHFGYYPNMTAVEFLDYLLLFYKIHSRKERQFRIERVLENVGLTPVKDQRLKTYSGGMLRRLGIAQALLNDPKLLIVDEPTAGLDPEERIRFRQSLNALIYDDSSRIVLLSTHIISDIAQISDQIGIVQAGQLLYSGSTQDFIQLNQNRIWEVEADYSQAMIFQEKYYILNSLPSENGVRYQIICDEPPAGGKAVHPDLEGAYFAFMRGDVA